MRRRVVETLAVVIGAALLVFYYLDRQPAQSQPAATDNVATPEAKPSGQPVQTVFPPVVETPESLPPVIDADSAIRSARAAWENARAEVAAVRSNLERLDSRFDAKDEEFARLEAEGLDGAELEERMLIFLDGIVAEYDELEGRLAAAEAAEEEAAHRLDELGGTRS